MKHPMCMWDNSVSSLTWSRRRGWWIQQGRKWLLTLGCSGRVVRVCWVIPQYGGGEMRMDPGHSYCCHLASLPVCGGKCVSVRQLVFEEIRHSEYLGQWIFSVLAEVITKLVKTNRKAWKQKKWKGIWPGYPLSHEKRLKKKNSSWSPRDRRSNACFSRFLGQHWSTTCM